MKNCNPTDKELNAWLDGELDAHDASRLEKLLRKNPQMRRHIDELREVRAIVRQAFDTDTPIRKQSPVQRVWRPRLAWMITAGLLLSIGAGFGWALHSPAASTLDPELEARGAIVLRTAQSPVPINENHNILLHISNDNHQYLLAALDETEKLLQRYEKLDRRVRLEVIANAGGIKLLRADSNSPYAKRVRELQDRYKNLTFLVCRNTLDLLNERRKGQVALVPDVESGASALEHVMKRLEEGWAYVKI
jgi:uncharacterized protein